MLHTKSQGHLPSGSWEEDFKMVFYHIWAWRSSWSCGKNILHKFWLTYHKESSHEIWVQLGQWFVRTLCFNILMGLQYEWRYYCDLSWKVKGQPWPLKLIYSHCLIRLNVSSEKNDQSFHSFQKNQLFQKFSHLNAFGSKFDLDNK